MVEKRVGGYEMRRMLIVLMFFLSMGTVSAQTGPVLDIRMDEGDGKTVADSSGNGNDGTHYGNTRLLMHFDEGNGTAVADESAYGNDGTIYGAAWVNGKSGKGLEFDGDGDYVDIADSASLQLGNVGTVLMWVKFDSIGELEGLITKADSQTWVDTDYGIVQRIAGKLTGVVSNGTTYNAIYSNTLSTDVWYHVAFTWDGSFLNLYIDTTPVTAVAQTVDIQQTSDPLRVGVWGTLTNYFNGTIDEVAVYSRALTAEEIQELYNAKKAKFVDWTDGKVGNALEFDGVDDYVEVGDDGSLDITDEITVGAWVKPDISSHSHVIATKGSYTYFFSTFGGKVRLLIGKADRSAWNVVVLGTTMLDNTNRYYLAGTYKNGIGKVYVNGIEDGNQTGTAEDIGSYGAWLSIGSAKSYADTYYFNGTIDEVRIWNRALTPEEIQEEYLKGEHFKTSSPVPSYAGMVTGSVMWTCVGQVDCRMNMALESPSGKVYREGDDYTKARAKKFVEGTVALPVIDYSVNIYSGYKRLMATPPGIENGEWNLLLSPSSDEANIDWSGELGWR